MHLVLPGPGAFEDLSFKGMILTLIIVCYCTRSTATTTFKTLVKIDDFHYNYYVDLVDTLLERQFSDR